MAPSVAVYHTRTIVARRASDALAGGRLSLAEQLEPTVLAGGCAAIIIKLALERNFGPVEI